MNKRKRERKLQKLLALGMAAATFAAMAALPLPAAAEEGETPGRYYIDAETGFLLDINKGTALEDFRADFPNAEVRVFTGKEELLAGYIATGQRIQIIRDEQAEEYTAVVPGDVSGNGTVDITDVMAACKILARDSNAQEPERDAAFAAAGVTEYQKNGGVAQTVTISDVMAICKAIASDSYIRYFPRIRLTSLSLDSPGLTLTTDNSQTLTPSLSDPAAFPYLTWSSVNPEVATVDGRGCITAVSPGRTVVVAAFNNLTTSCTVDVVAPAVNLEAGSFAIGTADSSFWQADEAGVLTLSPSTAGEAQKFQLEQGDTGYIIRMADAPALTLAYSDNNLLAFRDTTEETPAQWVFTQAEEGVFRLHPADRLPYAVTRLEAGGLGLALTDSGDANQLWNLSTAEHRAWIYNLQTSPNVRVRTGPSTDYETIGAFLMGQEITVTGQAVNGWYPVRGNNLGTGAVITGYTSGDYITFTEPDNNPEPMPEEIEKKLAELRVKFPDGKYWNHIGGENNPDGWTDTPCPSGQNDGDHTHATYLPGECDCNNFNNAIQCMGFAFKIGNELFGSNVRYWQKFYDFDQVKIGDYIRYGGHSVIVIGKDDTGVNVVECNFDHQCGIRWDRFIPRNTLESQNAEYRTHTS